MTNICDKSDKIFGANVMFTKDMKKRLREQIVDADFEFLHMNNDIHLNKKILERLTDIAYDSFGHIYVIDMINRIFNDLDGLEAEFNVKLSDLTRGLFTGIICTFNVIEKENIIQRKKDTLRANFKQK